MPVTDGTEVSAQETIAPQGAIAPAETARVAVPSRSVAVDVSRTPRWYACQTRGRTEKRVELRLARNGFESYLPLILRERKWADRTKRVAFPVFPGYVFARFPLTQLHRVLLTPGLATVVRMAGRPSPVRVEEIESIRALVEGANRTGVEPTPSDFLTEGQEVVVAEGAFSGMRGLLLEARGRSRVIVRLWAIRQAVGVEIDRRMLRPAKPRTAC
ncbi:MAG: transcription termination/antitermination protein NusG [Gemmatimonadota bacterium]